MQMEKLLNDQTESLSFTTLKRQLKAHLMTEELCMQYILIIQSVKYTKALM